jgi:hypothetical protein
MKLVELESGAKFRVHSRRLIRTVFPDAGYAFSYNQLGSVSLQTQTGNKARLAGSGVF